MPWPSALQLGAEPVADQAMHGAVRQVDSEVRAQPLLRAGVPGEPVTLDPLPQRFEHGSGQALLLGLRSGGADVKHLLQAASLVGLQPVVHAVAVYPEVFCCFAAAFHLAGEDQEQKMNARAPLRVILVPEPRLQIGNGLADRWEFALRHGSNLPG